MPWFCHAIVMLSTRVNMLCAYEGSAVPVTVGVILSANGVADETSERLAGGRFRGSVFQIWCVRVRSAGWRTAPPRPEDQAAEEVAPTSTTPHRACRRSCPAGRTARRAVACRHICRFRLQYQDGA